MKGHPCRLRLLKWLRRQLLLSDPSLPPLRLLVSCSSFHRSTISTLSCPLRATPQREGTRPLNRLWSVPGNGTRRSEQNCRVVFSSISLFNSAGSISSTACQRSPRTLYSDPCEQCCRLADLGFSPKTQGLWSGMRLAT